MVQQSEREVRLPLTPAVFSEETLQSPTVDIFGLAVPVGRLTARNIQQKDRFQEASKATPSAG